MKEEAIARGEEVPESESEMEEEVDPGVIPNADNATVLTHVCLPEAVFPLDYQQFRRHFRGCGCQRSYRIAMLPL